MNTLNMFKKDYKRQVIAILRLKEELLKVKYDITDYISPEDYEEVESWAQDFCKTIITQMKGFLKVEASITIADTNVCPWCIMYLQRANQYILKGIEKACAYSCGDCGYGNRHGNCMFSDNNTYTDIRNKLSVSSISSISGIPGLLDGIKKIIGVK